MKSLCIQLRDCTAGVDGLLAENPQLQGEMWECSCGRLHCGGAGLQVCSRGGNVSSPGTTSCQAAQRRVTVPVVWGFGLVSSLSSFFLRGGEAKEDKMSTSFIRKYKLGA